MAQDHTPDRLRFLLSYHYFKGVDLDALMEKMGDPAPEIFLDSGAFSAMTQGVPIDLDAYMEYIKRYEHHITVYSNLDVIRHPEETWANQQRMEDTGLSPLPVFHVATDWSWLEHYLERYRYIALGVAGTPGSVYRDWVAKCFRMAEHRAVYHGFGITNWEVLKRFRWYSVDSSSWGQGFRFGRVPLFDNRRGRWHKPQLGDGKAWSQLAPLVRSYGFRPRDFVDPDKLTSGGTNRERLCALSALSYVRAEHWLQERHGPVSIPGREDGLKLYLADGSTRNIPDAQAGLKLYLADSTTGQTPDSVHVANYLKQEKP